MPALPFAALAFVCAGLLGRALTDKLLALKAGAVAVAAWAQLGSLSDLVAGVSLAGIGTALTVLAAGAKSDDDARATLRTALLPGLALSLCAFLGGLAFLKFGNWNLLPENPGLAIPALLNGWLWVAPGMLCAWLLGRQQAWHAAAVATTGFVPPLLCLATDVATDPLDSLLLGQCLFGAAVTLALCIGLQRLPPGSPATRAALMRFVPTGLAIGILSPAAMAWARLKIADDLSWHAAGQVQALWRSTDWITAIMAGVLNAHFLPRLSRLSDRSAFLAELRTAAGATLIPSALFLLMLWLALPEVLTTLYRPDIAFAPSAAFSFLAGDWVRIASWVALFGLYARHASWAITAGEFLSLPLFALLLTIMPANHELSDVGLFWLTSYLVYAAFNFAMLQRSLPK